MIYSLNSNLVKKFPRDFAIININFLIHHDEKKKKGRKKLKSKYRQIIPKVLNHNKLVYLIRLGF